MGTTFFDKALANWKKLEDWAIRLNKFQIAMDAATPLCHGAHIGSPANRVDEYAKSRLRRKQESNCDILEKGPLPPRRTCHWSDLNLVKMRRSRSLKKETRAAEWGARAESWIMEGCVVPSRKKLTRYRE
jgi:hypothetical protein